jgi:ferredoxin-NADP reductase
MNGFAQTLGNAIGWLMIGWALLQCSAFSIRSIVGRVHRKREYVRAKADFCRRVEATAQAARATHAIPDWNGWRPFRVAAIVDEALDVKSFYLVPVDGRPLSSFAPGQYLTFRFANTPGKSALVRCYSLSDRPRQDYFRVTVKKVHAPLHEPGSPSGRGSTHFHDHVHIGDTLEVRAPAGTFIVDPAADEPIVLIGAGIGITPLVSMLEAIVHHGPAREVHALFGFRSGAEQPFKERLAATAAENPHLRLHISYTTPQPEDVLFRDYNDRGRITLDRVRQVLPSNNYRFFVCGPAPLMESLVPELWRWGVPESDVHFEAFGPATVKRVGTVAKCAASRWEVRFERSNRTAAWDGSFTSLLEFGEAAGVTMPSGCRAGSCGECMLPVGSGATVAVKKPGIPVPAGHCLACISAPAEAVVLDA